MKSNNETDPNEFARSLSESLTDMHDLCVVTAKAKLWKKNFTLFCLEIKTYIGALLEENHS